MLLLFVLSRWTTTMAEPAIKMKLKNSFVCLCIRAGQWISLSILTFMVAILVQMKLIFWISSRFGHYACPFQFITVSSFRAVKALFLFFFIVVGHSIFVMFAACQINRINIVRHWNFHYHCETQLCRGRRNMIYLSCICVGEIQNIHFNVDLRGSTIQHFPLAALFISERLGKWGT